MGRASRFAQTVRQNVVVHLKSGKSIAGVLREEYGDCVSLGAATLLSEAGPVQIDGEVLIRYEEIDFTQVGVAA
jgi:small nuclear ribonucleoprotein (snRNP)-like protein